MSDFLARIAERIMGQGAVIRPRLPSLYEPPVGRFAPPAGESAVSTEASGDRPLPEQADPAAAAIQAPVSPAAASPSPLVVAPAVAADEPPGVAGVLMKDPFVRRREPEELMRPGPEPESPSVPEAAPERLVAPIPLASAGTTERHPVAPRARLASPVHRDERCGVPPPTLARPAAARAGFAPSIGEAGGRHAEVAPIVRVTIGRIEFRAAPAPAAPPLPRRQSSLRPLEDYLRGGRRERS